MPTPTLVDPRLQLAPAPTRAHVWLGVLMVLPLAIIAGTHLIALRHGQSLLATPLAGVFVVVLWIVLDRLMGRHRIMLADGVLEVRTSMYRRRVALGELDLAQARVVRLAERTELKPMLKLNGYALPGFGSGHFLLRNRQRAFVATAGGDRVLWLPVTGQPGLLLQPNDPQRLLDHLRELIPPPTR